MKRKWFMVLLVSLMLALCVGCSVVYSHGGKVLGGALGDAEASVTEAVGEAPTECVTSEDGVMECPPQPAKVVSADGGNLGTGWFGMIADAIEAAMSFIKAAP